MSERLQKVLAAAGLGSRREMEDWIRAGRVRVNGKLAVLGQSVGPHDRVLVDGRPVRLRLGQRRLPRVLLYHKPEGEIVSRDDPQGRPTVFARLPRLATARWLSVGRLDLNTSGLLLFTTSGELANRLMHPRYGIQREYAVRVMGRITPEMAAVLSTGVDIDGVLARFTSIVERGGEGANRWYHVVIEEGRNREVRRMLEAVGLMVSRLIRVRYGPLVLPPRLKRGEYVELAREEVARLLEHVGLDALVPPDERAPRRAGRKAARPSALARRGG